MNPENKLYYPEGYKKLITDPAVLQSEFDEFVENTHESYKTIPLVKFRSLGHKEGSFLVGSGFILDSFKDKIIIATANHVSDHNTVSVTKDIYLEKKLIGFYEFEIDKILKSPLGESDLAFVLCKKPFGFIPTKVKISENFTSPRLLWGFLWKFHEGLHHEYSFNTGYLYELSKNLLYTQNEGAGQYSRQYISPSKLDPNRQVYYDVDMISKPGMSGGPIISQYWLEGIVKGSTKNGRSTLLPARSIVKQYEEHIKPLIK